MNNFNFTEQLKNMTIWCVWKRESNGKVPYNPHNGKLGKSNSIESFSDFETAVQALHKYNCTGLGIGIFNGVGAIDIDNCISDGKMSEMAEKIIKIMDTYTEISPSGNGIRILFTVTDFQYNKDLYYINNRNSHLEVYISEATNKFVTVTGNRINDKDLFDRSEQLHEVLDLYMKKTQTQPVPSKSVSQVQSNKDYLAIGLMKDEKLKAYWNGNRPKQSESENDCGFMGKLLYWCNNDDAKAIKAFRESPYAQQKDEEHRKKMMREDYIMSTLKTARPSTTAAEDDKKFCDNRNNQNNNYHANTIPAKNKPENKMNVMSAEDLQNTVFSPIEFLVNDLLPEGTTILAAPPKIGKSWFVLNMAICIASGTPFLKRKTKQVEVLYLTLEDKFRRVKDRQSKILNSTLAPSGLYYATTSPNLDGGLLDELKNQIELHTKIKLIIIDTFQKIRGEAKGRETTYQTDYREMGAVKEFADSCNLSVFFVHHTRKMKDEDPFEMVLGTNGIMGAVDTSFILKKKSRDSTNAELTITGRDIEDNKLVLNFSKESFQWNLVGNYEDVKQQELIGEYNNSSIVKGIRILVEKSKNKEWRGTASKFICECDLQGIRISTTAKSLGKEFFKLSDSLMKNDSITFDSSPNGNAGKTYMFTSINKDI